MNINTSRTLFLLAAAMSITACSSDSTVSSSNGGSIGDECSETQSCSKDLVCAYGICVEPTDPCVEIKCDEGILCRNGECQNSTQCGDAECTDKQVCKDDKCVDLCGNKACSDDEVCSNAKCVKSCNGKACGDDETCVDNTCVKSGDCGGIKCADGEICVDSMCKTAGDCGGIKCADDEVCQKDICREPGDCGGAKCAEDEVCHNSLCYPSGDCDGAGCSDNEVCHENICTPKGDCGGIECQNGLVCDIYNQICREPGDCDGVDCGELAFCMENSYCMDKEKCGDIYCEGGYICSESGECVPGPFCVDGRDRCGVDCCTDSQFCGDKAHCCEKAESCGQDCCGAGEVCINEMCHIQCEEGIERCTDAEGVEICCNSGEICVSNQCYAPTVSCVDDYQCENGEYCEPTQKTCLPKPVGPACQSKQKGGEVHPTTVWYWGNEALVPEAFPEYNYVMSAPMVADINGDGKVEVVFSSWKSGAYVGGGILRIVDGETGKTLHSSDGNPMTDGGGQVAIGNIRKDIDGLEIVACICTSGSCHGKTGGELKIALYNNKAEQIWQSQAVGYNECGQAGPGIADFDGDGNPEIYSRYNIYNGQTGEIIARVPCGDNAYWHQACDYPAAADLDGDGLPELVGGNVAYKVDVANKTMTPLYQRTDHPDGYPAIADLNLDGKPEIVVVRSDSSSLMAFNADGSDHWSAAVSHSALSGGPPTIANIDSTPEPEITFAGKTGYIAFNHDGTEKWKNNTHDFSSAKTGSSVFDFDGDGKAEVVYADECFLRVYDGESGKVRFCEYNTNGTHWEYPVIADIDNDNHAEILISANPYTCNIDESTGLDECTKPLIEAGVLNTQIIGLRAFSSPTKDWVNTRKIYNQHAYSITNVSDDGTIPQKVRNNWSTTNLNNFRMNVQPGATYLPDLEIQNLSAPRTCSELTPIYFNVVNVGWASADAGVTVHVYASETAEGPYTEIGTVKTTKLLRATETEALHFDYPKGTVSTDIIYLQFSFGDDVPTECQSGNNSADYVLNCTEVN